MPRRSPRALLEARNSLRFRPVPLFAPNAPTITEVTMPHSILRLPAVKVRTGLSRSTIYLRVWSII